MMLRGRRAAQFGERVGEEGVDMEAARDLELDEGGVDLRHENEAEALPGLAQVERERRRRQHRRGLDQHRRAGEGGFARIGGERGGDQHRLGGPATARRQAVFDEIGIGAEARRHEQGRKLHEQGDELVAESRARRPGSGHKRRGFDASHGR